MNCDLCRSRCKADCCRGPIPMERHLLETKPHIRPATMVKDLGNGMVAAMHVDATHHAVCPFLGLDDKCSIYEDRPLVCRLFGNETHPDLTCSFLSADDRIRPRGERRRIEKEHAKRTQAALK